MLRVEWGLSMGTLGPDSKWCGAFYYCFLFTLLICQLKPTSILIRRDAPIPNQDTLLTPIDWETVHFGCQNQDVGQIVGELSLINQGDELAVSDQVLQGLASGYQSLEDESVFHVVFYAGLHILMLLLTEGEPNTPKQNKLVRFARDCILKGAKQDRQWLETTPLKHLLKASQ